MNSLTILACYHLLTEKQKQNIYSKLSERYCTATVVNLINDGLTIVDRFIYQNNKQGKVQLAKYIINNKNNYGEEDMFGQISLFYNLWEKIDFKDGDNIKFVKYLKDNSRWPCKDEYSYRSVDKIYQELGYEKFIDHFIEHVNHYNYHQDYNDDDDYGYSDGVEDHNMFILYTVDSELFINIDLTADQLSTAEKIIIPIDSCIRLLSEYCKIELMNKIFNSMKIATLFHFMVDINSSEYSSISVEGQYLYRTKEDLVKKILNDKNLYRTYICQFTKRVYGTSFFTCNDPLFKVWSRYNLQNRDAMRLVQKIRKEYKHSWFINGNLCEYITMDTVNKLYEEIGYNVLIDHLNEILDIDLNRDNETAMGDPYIAYRFTLNGRDMFKKFGYTLNKQ